MDSLLPVVLFLRLVCISCLRMSKLFLLLIWKKMLLERMHLLQNLESSIQTSTLKDSMLMVQVIHSLYSLMILLKSIGIKKEKMVGGITIFPRLILRISMVSRYLEKLPLEMILIQRMQKDSKKFLEMTALIDS